MSLKINPTKKAHIPKALVSTQSKRLTHMKPQDQPFSALIEKVGNTHYQFEDDIQDDKNVDLSNLKSV